MLLGRRTLGDRWFLARRVAAAVLAGLVAEAAIAGAGVVLLVPLAFQRRVEAVPYPGEGLLDADELPLLHKRGEALADLCFAVQIVGGQGDRLLTRLGAAGCCPRACGQWARSRCRGTSR